MLYMYSNWTNKIKKTIDKKGFKHTIFHRKIISKPYHIELLIMALT